MDASHADQLRRERKSGWNIFLYSTLTTVSLVHFASKEEANSKKAIWAKLKTKNVVRSSKSHKSFQNIHLGHRQLGWTIIQSHRKF